MPYQTPAPAPKKTRKIFGIIGIIVVLLVVIWLVLWLVLKQGDSSEKAIRDYLEALQNKDAKTALQYANKSVDDTLLTNEVLDYLQSSGRGVDVIISVDKNEASYLVSGQKQVVSFAVDNSKSDIKFPVAATVEIQTQVPVKVADQPVEGTIQLFPGKYTLTSNSDNIHLMEDFLIGDPQLPVVVKPGVSLTDAGRIAARGAAEEALSQCIAAKQLAPKGCPFKLSQPENGIIDESSITYQLKTQNPFENVTFEWDSASNLAVGNVSVQIAFSAEGYMKDGSNAGTVNQTLDLNLVAKVDVTTDQPTVTWMSR